MARDRPSPPLGGDEVSIRYKDNTDIKRLTNVHFAYTVSPKHLRDAVTDLALGKPVCSTGDADGVNISATTSSDGRLELKVATNTPTRVESVTFYIVPDDLASARDQWTTTKANITVWQISSCNIETVE